MGCCVVYLGGGFRVWSQFCNVVHCVLSMIIASFLEYIYIQIDNFHVHSSALIWFRTKFDRILETCT